MPYDVTHVIDAGARYGVHPSWTSFHAEMRYLAFEPDEQEASRLRADNPIPGYEVHAAALGERSGRQRLYVTSHRGLCSFLPPDPESFWFKHYRPQSGIVQRTTDVEVISIDDFGKQAGLDHIDFLKVDTEGTELHVLRGSERYLRTSVLGCHVSVSFQRAYLNQPLFCETHQYLAERGFFLCNMDYLGYGMPQSPIFRKPDPLAPERLRYGILMHADAVWLLPIDTVLSRFASDPAQQALASLKYAVFCLQNNAADVGLSALKRCASHSGFPEAVRSTSLYRHCRRAFAALLGQWRVSEDQLWDQVRHEFTEIFGVRLEGGSGYWQQINSL